MLRIADGAQTILDSPETFAFVAEAAASGVSQTDTVAGTNSTISVPRAWSCAVRASPNAIAFAIAIFQAGAAVVTGASKSTWADQVATVSIIAGDALDAIRCLEC